MHKRLAFLTLALSLAACGGAQKNHYQASRSRQESCCHKLADAARDQCLAEIPRIDDPGAQTSPLNQETFHCVEAHFTCDPTTGRATRESAQAQLDCLNELDSTAQLGASPQ